jgi:hypothetical protein
MDKLLSDLENKGEDGVDGEAEMLQEVKVNLTKGSGKFIVVNSDNKVLSRNGMYTETKYSIKFFKSVPEAMKEKNTNDKIVRI